MLNIFKAGSYRAKAYDAIHAGMKLTNYMSDALCNEARSMVIKAGGNIAEAIKKFGSNTVLEVHHIIPLEWVHLMGAGFDPNDVKNLAGVLKGNQIDLTEAWRRFKELIPNPSKAKIEKFANDLMKEFSDIIIKD